MGTLSGRCGPDGSGGLPWWSGPSGSGSGSPGFGSPSYGNGGSATTGSSWRFCTGPTTRWSRCVPASCASSSCSTRANSWWPASPSFVSGGTLVRSGPSTLSGREGVGCPTT